MRQGFKIPHAKVRFDFIFHHKIFFWEVHIRFSTGIIKTESFTTHRKEGKIIPPQRWKAVNMDKVREIFEKDSTPLANDKLKAYIKSVFLSGGSVLNETNEIEIEMAFNSIKKRARARGWVKPSHNAKLHASAWPTWKKKLYQQLYNRGFSTNELAEHSVFKDDFAYCADKESAVRNFARSIPGCSAKKRREAIARRKVETKPPSLPVRRWPEAEIIEVPKTNWERPGQRVAYFSYGPYRVAGWRRGLFTLGGLIFALEGCHFPVFAGGFLSKDWIQAEIKKLSEGVPKRFVQDIIHHVKEETVKALQYVLPRFKKPDGTFIRWYIMASKPVDGKYGEDILRRLQELMPNNMRQYSTGGEKIEVTMPDGRSSIYHGVVLPKRSRLPAKYMSAKVERDIEDVEEQTSREYPHLWVHGTSASAIYKPAGERMVPYISLPAFHKLEAEDKKISENQVGMAVVEEMPDGDRLIHFWSFRDLIAQEREFITGIKDGASDLHKKIVEVLKRSGARHPGRLIDDLNRLYGIEIDQKRLEEEIKFLVEPKRSTRLTWPGLQYDEASQRYDFHLDWIQETLRYVFPSLDKEGWHEDSFLFFGCLHAGYTTTDYEFVMRKFVEKILQYNIKVFCGIGDFIAGLAHSMMHRGEIFQMNNTDQEQFAGEMLATIIYRVFTSRFEKKLEASKEKTLSREEVLSLVDECLLLFLIKKGNHDRWQERDGNTALDTFYRVLKSLLIQYIHAYLFGKGFAEVDPRQIIERKMVFLPEYRPIYTLASGIKVGLTHPHMARADTTSLRAEKALRKFSNKWGCQVVGIANFHVATSIHKWWPHIGQTVAVQTGTEVIDTDFELNKLKDLDFGPLYLKVLSYKGRIYRTTITAFNKPLLEDPYRKDIDVQAFKKKLGLLGYTN